LSAQWSGDGDEETTMTTCNHPANAKHTDALLMTCPDCGAECSGSQVGDDRLCYDDACPLHVLAGKHLLAGRRPVNDYQTGAELDGDASETLAARSAEAGDTGAVPAYRDEDGVWQYVRPDEVEQARRQGRDVRTVWVQ
jgi:hypothetical protein